MGRLMVFVTAPLIVLAIKTAGYQVNDLALIRQNVRDLMKAHPGPWLICANHLTLIDSVILAYAMIPTYRYMVEFKSLPWNVPEQMNFNRNLLVGLICFLTKCIPIVRGGDRGRTQIHADKMHLSFKQRREPDDFSGRDPLPVRA